jgi:NADPH:quinone reductase-like Zn-dependent oxidoreductase
MNQLEENAFDLVIDTQGGQNAYDAAKRILKDGGKWVYLRSLHKELHWQIRIITMVPPDETAHVKPENIAKPSGLKAFRAAFQSKRQTTKAISFEYLPPAGSGEPEVDGSGMDIRDVLEEPAIVAFRPVVSKTLPLEKGAEAFMGVPEGVVVRIIH